MWGYENPSNSSKVKSASVYEFVQLGFFSLSALYALKRSVQKTVFISSWKTAASAGSEDKTDTHTNHGHARPSCRKQHYLWERADAFKQSSQLKITKFRGKNAAALCRALVCIPSDCPAVAAPGYWNCTVRSRWEFWQWDKCISFAKRRKIIKTCS